MNFWIKTIDDRFNNVETMLEFKKKLIQLIAYNYLYKVLAV